MKRRKFGLLAGTSMLSAAAAGQAGAQTSAVPDASLLTTTLTPFGAERAGNADGSIPAWTGGMVGDPNGPTGIRVFEDEQPLFTVDASNMAQHLDLLSDGVQWQIKNAGYSIKVFPTHRTAAAPQYVYDNIAKNVTRSQFSPNGGRFGFTGGYGGAPFPIIDTADPLTAGAQLIWNHLTGWQGFYLTGFTPGFVTAGGSLELSEGNEASFVYPYYDPNGTPETFDGYLSKTHLAFKAPATFDGQEALAWHSVNVDLNKDITWTLLNGQGRVRKAPDEAYDSPNGYFNDVANQDESSGFYGNPSQYDWTLIEKKEMYIPYHCNNIRFATVPEMFSLKFPNVDLVRWEKHRVWVLEANLHPGIRNVLSRRRFYLDEDTWFIAVGEGYDGGGNLAKIYHQYLHVMPALPCVFPVGFAVFSLLTGDWLYTGNLNTPPFTRPEIVNQTIPPAVFDPENMAANAAF
jgi:hypothetical protein